jgi:hypothetical protein
LWLFTEIGNRRTVRLAKSLAARDIKTEWVGQNYEWKQSRIKVVTTARELLPAIKACVYPTETVQTLLRPASPPETASEVLVRPARSNNAVEAERMVRPIENDLPSQEDSLSLKIGPSSRK